MSITRRIFGGTALAAMMLAGGAAHADDPVRIALVVKALGIGFFEAANDGDGSRGRAWQCRDHLYRPDIDHSRLRSSTR